MGNIQGKVREKERGGGRENEDVIVREILTIERKGGKGREGERNKEREEDRKRRKTEKVG